MSNSKEKQKPLPTYINFVTAGAGGCFGWIVVHPFNTAAIQMSLSVSNTPGARNPSFFSYMNNVYKEKRILSLYKGLSAGLIRQIFYASSRFGLFEVFRDGLAKYRETDFFSRMIVGVLSGGVAAVISCPAEVSLVRISNDLTLPVNQRRNYTGAVNAFVRIINEEGFMAFFNGCGPFVNRCMLVGAVQVGTYDQFRASLRAYGVVNDLQNVFAASMASGFLYSLVTMPFETSKNRMASQIKDVSGKYPYTGTFQTITKIIRDESFLTLWKGYAPYYLRCGGHTVAMFAAVEQLRKLYYQF